MDKRGDTATYAMESREDLRTVLDKVVTALKDSGYDPISQLAGYVIVGDPAYITTSQGARALICRYDRDEILEELISSYLKNSAVDGPMQGCISS